MRRGNTIRNGPGTPSDRIAINASRYDTDRPPVEILQGHYASTVTLTFGASNPPELPENGSRTTTHMDRQGLKENQTLVCQATDEVSRANFPYHTTMKPLKMADQAD